MMKMMKMREYTLLGLLLLLVVDSASASHNGTQTISATIGNTNFPAQISPIDIEGRTFSWNGATVTVSRYPATGTNKARIQIVNDLGVDTIQIANAKFSTDAAIANFPINFESSNLGPPPTTSPYYYYAQGAGSFVDNTPLNGKLTTVGKINPDPVSNPGWNQIGNTLVHDTANCSCKSFSPSLGYKTYAQSDFAHQRGLKAEILLNLGNPNEAVQLAYVKVNSDSPPGTDDSVDKACRTAEEDEPCEEPVGLARWWCEKLGLACPRCYDKAAYLLLLEKKSKASPPGVKK